MRESRRRVSDGLRDTARLSFFSLLPALSSCDVDARAFPVGGAYSRWVNEARLSVCGRHSRVCSFVEMQRRRCLVSGVIVFFIDSKPTQQSVVEKLSFQCVCVCVCVCVCGGRNL